MRRSVKEPALALNPRGKTASLDVVGYFHVQGQGEKKKNLTQCQTRTDLKQLPAGSHYLAAKIMLKYT